MARRGFCSLIGILILSTISLLAAETAIEIDSATFGGLRARDIGPAVMSGRIAAIDASAADPVTVWVGSASGGVWKSDNAATSFKPVFDDHTQSIGALRIDPSDAETVWVGTGETWVRNSVSVGSGVYRTTDGGDSWEHLGLEGTEVLPACLLYTSDAADDNRVV